MAALDSSQCPAVESIPGKRSGAWVFRDTRTPVSVVFDNLEVGASVDEIMEWFHLSREQVTSVIEFTARSLDAHPAIPQITRSVASQCRFADKHVGRRSPDPRWLPDGARHPRPFRVK